MDDGVKFEKSKEKGKKYLAILPDGQHVNFGALGYQHYEDRTPLKLHSHLDHKDPQDARDTISGIRRTIRDIALIGSPKLTYGEASSFSLSAFSLSSFLCLASFMTMLFGFLSDLKSTMLHLVPPSCGSFQW